MELYTIFRGDERFMQGEYSEQQKKINGNFNETYDLMVESLFGHQNQSGSRGHHGCKPSSPKPRYAAQGFDVAMAIRPPFLFGANLMDASAGVQGVRSAAPAKNRRNWKRGVAAVLDLYAGPKGPEGFEPPRSDPGM